MAVCPSCKREITSLGKFCPECGAALPPAPPAAPPPAAPPPAAESAEAATLGAHETRPPSSHPSSSSSIHGRFEPGTRLGARYRVVGLLGRGGMGEVYRADDLELNQSVALKFLPEKVARNSADLARLRQEVRIARQIAHPNVCRTYDISEADGQVFVVMEYVDGEDLASVLRRLGRPTEDKALEIARQLCLGIGAAHENGVLHRDLKPANIMIDGRGRVRITDFGLAGTAEEIAAQGGVSGTPGYMAPEQQRSGTASIQSDIFSLGLVLYELFTGKRAADVTPRPASARPASERPDSDSQVRTPSSLVGGVDPAVERVILRCLERDPARRPQSAYAVFGALPGGDPLAAAVAAGETPSPELVANAGVEGSVRPLYAALAVLIVLIAMFWASWAQRPLFAGLGRSPEALSLRAEEVLSQLTGNSPPHYSSRGLRYAPPDSAKGPKRAGPLQFWRRWSPVPLTTSNIHDPGSSAEDPPQTYPGSGSVVLDQGGRLLALSIVPPRSADSSATPVPDWEGLLRLVGRTPASLVAAASPPLLFASADTVVAWSPADSSSRDTVLVAAAVQGRIVDVETLVRGRRLGKFELRPPPNELQGVQAWVFMLLFYAIPLAGSIVLAMRNIRSGRVDMRGAVVMGVATTLLYVLFYLFTVNQNELGFLAVLVDITGGSALAHALLHGVALFLAYLAIEPYVRRLWPGVLVSWARLVAGRGRDPIVGRDILAGAVMGVLFFMADKPYLHLVRTLGLSEDAPQLSFATLNAMLGTQEMLAQASIAAALGLLRLTIYFTLLIVLRFVLRNNRAAAIAIGLLFGAAFVSYGMRTTWVELGVGLALNFAAVFLVLRFGFLAGIVGMTTGLMLADLPWSADLGTWAAPQTILAWLILLGMLGYGFVIAVKGKSLFRDPLSDPVRNEVRPGR